MEGQLSWPNSIQCQAIPEGLAPKKCVLIMGNLPPEDPGTFCWHGSGFSPTLVLLCPNLDGTVLPESLHSNFTWDVNRVSLHSDRLSVASRKEFSIVSQPMNN